MIGFGLGLPTVAASTGGDKIIEATFLVNDDNDFMLTDDNEYILTLQFEAPDPE